jgi:hypothetical protein
MINLKKLKVYSTRRTGSADPIKSGNNPDPLIAEPVKLPSDPSPKC